MNWQGLEPLEPRLLLSSGLDMDLGLDTVGIDADVAIISEAQTTAGMLAIPGLDQLLDPTVITGTVTNVPGPPSPDRHGDLTGNSVASATPLMESRKVPGTPYAAIHPNHLTELYPDDSLGQISQKIQGRYDSQIMSRVGAPTVTSITVQNMSLVYPVGYFNNAQPVTVYTRRFTLNSAGRTVVGYYLNYDKLDQFDDSVIFQINGHFGSQPSRIGIGLNDNGGLLGAALGKIAMLGYPLITYDDHNVGESSGGPNGLPRTLETIVQMDQTILTHFGRVDGMGLSGGTERLYHYMLFFESNVQSAYFAGYFNPPWTQYDSVNDPNSPFGVNQDTYDNTFNGNFLNTDLALVGIERGVTSSFINASYEGGSGKYGYFVEMVPEMQQYTNAFQSLGDDANGDGVPDYGPGLYHEYNLPEFLDWIEAVRTLPAGAVRDAGEVGQVTVSHLGQTVLLQRSYVDPVVFAQSASYNGAQQVIVRITDVQADRFTVQLQEAPDLNGAHTGEDISYLVLEAGLWQLPNGSLLEAGTVDTSATVGKNVIDVWESIALTGPFAAEPLVMSQAQTANDASYASTRQTNHSATGFDVALHEEEASVAAHGIETIGYLALEQSQGLWGAARFEAGYTTDSVTHNWHSFGFSTAFAGAPNLLTHVTSYNGADSAHARYQSVTPTGAQVKIEEDTTADTETNHVTEVVGYVAIEGTGVLQAISLGLPMGEVGLISDLRHDAQTIVLDQTYTNPVVIAQSASFNGTAPVVARISNVQSDRFTIQLQEPPNEDGSHTAEVVTYVVMEQGEWLLSNGTLLEVGTIDTAATVGRNVTETWASVTLVSPFASTPVFFSQVQTANDASYVSTRQANRAPTGFDVAMEEEEASLAAHGTETIGYMAIQSAVGEWGGRRFESAYTPDAVDELWYSVNFASNFTTAPGLLSSIADYDGIDSSHARYQNLDNAGVQFRMMEDTSADTELLHTFETFGYLAIEGTGVLLARNLGSPMGEAGQVNNLTHDPQTIVLSRSYTNPVVIAQSASTNGTQPVIVRITDVQSDRFTMYLQEPPDEDGLHTTERVTWIVLEAGIWELPDGRRLEVGTVDTSATVHRTSQIWEQVSFSGSFTATPVIMSQVQTTNDTSYVSTRQNDLTSTGFKVAMEEEESSTAAHGTETIGYLAIESGAGVWGALQFEAGYTGDTVTDEWSGLNFTNAFTSAPGLLAALGTYDGRDNAHLRYTNLTATGAQVKIEEDTTLDSEVVHSTEIVVYLVIEGQGILTGTQVVP